jgi:hypothetical protein
MHLLSQIGALIVAPPEGEYLAGEPGRDGEPPPFWGGGILLSKITTIERSSMPLPSSPLAWPLSILSSTASHADAAAVAVSALLERWLVSGGGGLPALPSVTDSPSTSGLARRIAVATVSTTSWSLR